MILSDDFLSRVKLVEEGQLDVGITVDQWAEQRRMIKKPGAKKFTLWDFDDSPYLRYPCQLVSKNTPTKRLSVSKGSRIGFTQGLIMNSIFYNIDVNPVKMMYVSADQKLLDKFTRVEFKPQLKATGLYDKIRASAASEKNKNRSSGETSEMLEFGVDGYLVLSGANNPNNFRQLGAQYAYKDERATYPLIKSEGDVSKLVDGRTRDYGNSSKIITVSTPTLAGSGFHKEWLAGTQEFWMIPCPHCDTLQYLDFGETKKHEDGTRELIYGLDFKHENYELKSEVRYKCKYCHKSFPESLKYDLNLKGDWIPTKKEYNKSNVSLQINSLYSNFYSWTDIVEEFLEAKADGSPTALQGFKNLIMGEFFEFKAKTITVQNLMDRPSGYCRSEVPEGVGFITACCDVQADRLEIEFKGWGLNKENWSIEYVILKGNTEKHDVWNDFEELIFSQQFAGLTPVAYFIDEGDGNKQDQVQGFCRRMNLRATNEYYEKTGKLDRDGNKIVKHVALPLKGMSPKQLNRKPYSVNDISEGLKRLHVNTYYYKEKVMTWMNREFLNNDGEEKPFGFCNFPADYPKKYFSQLRSEKLVKTLNTSGYTEKKWEQVKTRNEAFDLFVYNACEADWYFECVILPIGHVIDYPGGVKVYNDMINYFLNQRKSE